MKKSLLLAAASLAVISCSKRAMETAENPGVQDPNAVQFSTGGIAATPGSKVTGNPEVGSENGLIFQTNDVIGVYAVLHGKKLGAGDEFPTNTAVQYKQKLYKATSVAGASDAVPFLATFAPKTTTAGADETIYYLPGGQEYNYYAFYPTTDGGMPRALSNYVYTENTSIGATAWVNQVGIFTQNTSTGDWEAAPQTQSWPGPILYAYSSTADKAPAVGTSATPVKLTFKHAVAKLTLDVTVDQTVAPSSDITAIELFADEGLYQGFTLDLKQAHETTPEVVKTNTSGAKLDGSGTGSAAATYKFANQYAAPTAGATQTTTKVIGYLIPTTGIENAKIRFTFGTGSNAQVFTAKLDKSATGDDSSATGTNHFPTIEAGKDYQFKINIQKTGVTFTGTIEDWSVEDKTGTIIDAE